MQRGWHSFFRVYRASSIGLNRDPSRGGPPTLAVDRASLAACKLQTSLESPVISIPHLFHGNYKNNSDLYLTAYHEGESYLYAARWLVC